MPIEVEVDASDVTAGYESSRRVKFSQDVIPPLSRMVIMVRKEKRRNEKEREGKRRKEKEREGKRRNEKE